MNSVTTVEADSDSIVLKKLSKGYGWEIKVYGMDIFSIVEKIDLADGKLKEKYGESE